MALTGSPAEIEAVLKAYKVYSRKADAQAGGEYLMDHSTFTYVMGPDGGIYWQSGVFMVGSSPLQHERFMTEKTRFGAGGLVGWLSLAQLISWGSLFYTFALVMEPVEPWRAAQLNAAVWQDVEAYIQRFLRVETQEDEDEESAEEEEDDDVADEEGNNSPAA